MKHSSILFIVFLFYSCGSSPTEAPKITNEEQPPVESSQKEITGENTSPVQFTQEDLAVENSGELSQEYIDKRNVYLKKLGKIHGIQFKALPVIGENNVIDLEEAKKIFKKYGPAEIPGPEMQNYKYITEEAALYLSVNRKEFKLLLQYLVYLSSEAAEHLIKANTFISLASLETLDTETALTLGKLKRKGLDFYNLKYLSEKQAAYLLQGKKWAIEMPNLCHMDKKIAEAIASSSVEFIMMGKKLSKEEKKFWIAACIENEWTKCLGEEFLSNNQQEVIDSNYNKIKICLGDLKMRKKKDCFAFLNRCQEGYEMYKKLSSSTRYDLTDEEIRKVCEICTYNRPKNSNKRK